jgi:bile acid-coenzyme A ligase
MTATATQPVSHGRRIALLAAEHPDKIAIIHNPIEGPERTVSYAELDQRANQVAHRLAAAGVNSDSMVVIGLPNIVEHFFAAYGAWRLGALVLPVKATLPERERDQILELANPAIVVTDWEGLPYKTLSLSELRATETDDASPLPDIIPHPGKSVGSGGSTGRSKIIVDPAPWARVPDSDWAWNNSYQYRPGQVQLIAGPLYHNSPFSWAHNGLFDDQTIVVMEKFDAARAVELIERHRVNWVFMAPTMMKRIITLPDIKERDLSSLAAIWHTAAPCPAWLKRAWIDLIGPERVHESFGSAEALGGTSISGTEWLAHPGSVGRPDAFDEAAEMKILDEDGNEVPVGEVGEIFWRRTEQDEEPYYYIGSPPVKTMPDGFASVGDMGWVDEEGYLYIADRRTDMVITGGANVYPAEVEAALHEHPGVLDVAVIGVPDEDWGKRVHAVIQAVDPANPPTVAELNAHARERISSYKVPKTWEFVPLLPRDDSGKIRRSALAAEREAGWTEGMLRA